jgi:myo-inositol-1(or 4)-monophosphatase
LKMDQISIRSMLEVGKEAAREAGTFLRESFRTDFRVSRKGPINYVTEMDLRAEQMILKRVQRSFPDHQFLAEEGGTVSSDSHFRWIIDPLDGTTNYAHGFPAFCVSIALEQEGRLEAGIIYDPIADEMFSAATGQGAFLNDVPMRVSGQAELEESLLGTGFSYDPEALRVNLGLFAEFMTRAAGVRRVGSAARDLAFVACGRFDGVWEYQLNPWDVAAGIVLIREAGGSVTDFEGRPCGPEQSRLLLTNGKIHQAMLAVLCEHCRPE